MKKRNLLFHKEIHDPNNFDFKKAAPISILDNEIIEFIEEHLCMSALFFNVECGFMTVRINLSNGDRVTIEK